MRRYVFTTVRLPLPALRPRSGSCFSAPLAASAATFYGRGRQDVGSKGGAVVKPDAAAATTTVPSATLLASQNSNTTGTETRRKADAEKVPHEVPRDSMSSRFQHTASGDDSAKLLRKRAPATQETFPKGGAAEGTGTESPTAGSEATVGVKPSAEDELARAFNRFSRSVGGCNDEEFRQGAQQAYYSLGVLNAALAEQASPIPQISTLTGSGTLVVVTSEAKKLIGSKFLPEKEWAEPPVLDDQTEALVQGLGADDASAAVRGVLDVIRGITSVIPMSPFLAMSVFSTWHAQREKKQNLFAIAGPSDYVLDTKLVVFTRLDTTKVYFAENEDIGATIELVFASEFLQQGQRYAREEEDGAMNENTVVFSADGHHVVHRTVVPGTDGRKEEGENGVTKATTDNADAVRTTKTATNENKAESRKEETPEAPARGAAKAKEEPKLACTVKVNGQPHQVIPTTARACAVFTMDVVVPPERYTNNYEWYYKRIIGYESEYERVAAARLFAQNTPKWVASFFDFVTRMFTGKPVEFMFTKAIGKMVGLPENVDECPPAHRKLVTMYMDQTKKWVLAGIQPLYPVNTTKLPAAPK